MSGEVKMDIREREQFLSRRAMAILAKCERNDIEQLRGLIKFAREHKCHDFADHMQALTDDMEKLNNLEKNHES